MRVTAVRVLLGVFTACLRNGESKVRVLYIYETIIGPCLIHTLSPVTMSHCRKFAGKF